MACYKGILDGIGQSRKNNIAGQMNLFDLGGTSAVAQTDELPHIEEFPQRELLAMEKEVLGIYVSGHPLAVYEKELRRKVSHTSVDFLPEEEDEDRMQVAEGTKVSVGGMIAAKSVKYTRNNEKMCFLTLEDLQGTMEIIVFPKVMEQCGAFLEEESVVLVKGRANVSADSEAKVIAASVVPLMQSEAEKQSASLWLKQPAGEEVPLVWITAILQKYKGETPVYIYEEKTKQKMKADRKFWVTLEEGLLEELRELLGERNVAVKNG